MCMKRFDSYFILPQSEVTLCGNAPWLRDLARTMTSKRLNQLRRIKRFLKIQTTKQYVCPRTGVAKCVEASFLRFLRCDDLNDMTLLEYVII